MADSLLVRSPYHVLIQGLLVPGIMIMTIIMSRIILVITIIIIINSENTILCIRRINCTYVLTTGFSIPSWSKKSVKFQKISETSQLYEFLGARLGRAGMTGKVMQGRGVRLTGLYSKLIKLTYLRNVIPFFLASGSSLFAQPNGTYLNIACYDKHLQ